MTFPHYSLAEEALEATHGVWFNGRSLHVAFAEYEQAYVNELDLSTLKITIGENEQQGIQ